MKLYSFPRNSVWRRFFYVWFLLLLLLSRDTLITSSIIGFYKATFLKYGIIATLAAVFFWRNYRDMRDIMKDERMLVVATASLVFLLPMVWKQDWQLMYLSILICIFFAVFLSYLSSIEEIARVFIAILSFLSVYSWVSNYILNNAVDAGLINAPVFSNGMHSFYNFGFSCVPINHPQSYRNFGIFREPGVYQFFLIIGLILNNYFIDWDKNWKYWVCNIVLSITMLTTFATGGIIEIALLFLVLFIDKKWYTKKQTWIIAGTLLSLLVIVSKYTEIDDNILYRATQMIKKIFVTTPSSSGGVRYQSIIVDLQLFLQKPFFGEKLSVVMYAESLEFNTTSTMILFAAYGIMAGCFHVLSWIALLWNRNRKAWLNLALLLIMFMSFNTQDLTANIFFWLFPIMAMVEKGIPLVKSLKIKKKA